VTGAVVVDVVVVVAALVDVVGGRVVDVSAGPEVAANCASPASSVASARTAKNDPRNRTTASAATTAGARPRGFPPSGGSAMGSLSTGAAATVAGASAGTGDDGGAGGATLWVGGGPGMGAASFKEGSLSSTSVRNGAGGGGVATLGSADGSGGAPAAVVACVAGVPQDGQNLVVSVSPHVAQVVSVPQVGQNLVVIDAEQAGQLCVSDIGCTDP